MKIKLCCIISSLCNEGPVNVMYNELRFIDYNKYDVFVITLNPEKTSSRMEAFRKLPIQIFQLSPFRRTNLFCLYLKLRKLLSKIHPDLLHGHCSGPLYLMSFMPKKYKRVYTIHTYPGICNIAISGKLKGNIIIRLDNFFTNWCDTPICCSQNIANSYLAEKGKNYKAIPNGASFKIWKYDKEEKARLRKQLSLDLEKKYFIFIGRFSDEKNPKVLLSAFKEIEDPDVELIMLGDGPLFEECKSVCPSNVKMIGFTQNVQDYLKASDYYVAPSEIEGLANTTLENMSVGLPMLLSNIPAHEEVLANFINPDEVGLIFDRRNFDDLVSKIKEIQLLSVCSTQEKIQKVYLDNYTAEKMAQRYQREYERLYNLKYE